MDSGTLRFLLVVLALGVVAIGAVFAWTRMREKAADAELAAPPDRVVPGLAPDEAGPAYVPADEALTPKVSHALADDARADVRLAVEQREADVDAGWADRRLVTDPASGLVVLDDARVAALTEGLGNVREYLALVARAGAHPLVVVTTDVESQVLETVVANLAQGHRTDTVVRASASSVASLAERLGVRATTRADLQSGWVPTLPVVDRWVSDATSSWTLSQPSA